MASILENLLAPYDFLNKPDLAFGVIQYVFLEVIVSRIFRYVLKQPAPWGVDFAVHFISIPFLGGLSAFAESQGELKESDFLTLLLDGAKGIPGVFVAQYVVQSFQLGPVIPHFNLRDLLITAASKAITRPIAGFLYNYVFPDKIKEQWDDVDAFVAFQNTKSNIKVE